MEITIPGKCKILCDPDTTRAIYGKIESGYANLCLCLVCRHYSLYRDHYLPEKLSRILLQLGIDRLKEAEIYYSGGNIPVNGRFHIWYHFVGKLEKYPAYSRDKSFILLRDEVPGSVIRVTEDCQMVNSYFFDHNILQLEFSIEATDFKVHSPDR